MANGLFTLKQVNQALRQSAWSNQKTPSVQYLVVAGGGGGGEGGGGAGGLLTGTYSVATGSAITVTIGAGGSYPNNGGNSVFGNITSIGGGRGGVEGTGTPSGYGIAGGSGGGGSYSSTLTTLGGQGIFNQGNAGGGNNAGAPYPSGGGGGAGTVGFKAVGSIAGNGGAGIASSINGTVTNYAGGGGGGLYASGTIGTGGVGGGGNGGNAGVGNNGTVNTGGGGGGGAGASTGGSGIVILSYPDTYAAAASSTNATVTTSGSGSISFNGSSYLTISNSSAFSFGSGDFTIEGWVYLSSVVDGTSIFAGGDLYTTKPPFMFYVDGLNNKISFYASSNGSSYDIASGVTVVSSISAGNWYYFSASRTGTSIRLFSGGTLVNTVTSASALVSTSNAYVMGAPTAGRVTGYISNLRVVKGTGLYTASYTAPTAPLTSVTNTQLLLNSVSGAYLLDSSTNAFNATVTGTPSWNSSSPFATGLGYKNRVYTWTTSGSITF